MDIVTYALCMGNDNYLKDLIESMNSLQMVVQDTVPTVETAEPNKLYLVDINHDGVYEEYVLAEVEGVQQIVELGSFTDLTNYYNKTEINTLLAGLHIECTQAQYDLLTPAQKNNGAEYFITDAETEGDFAEIETRLDNLEANFVVIYENGSDIVRLYTQNTTKVIKVDANTIEWYITDPDSHRNFKATVTATGEGSVRTNPQVTVTEVV